MAEKNSPEIKEKLKYELKNRKNTINIKLSALTIAWNWNKDFQNQPLTTTNTKDMLIKNIKNHL